MNLLKGRGLSKLGCRVAQNTFIGGAVVETLAFRIDQRDHIGGVFGDDLKKLFALPGLAPDVEDVELQVRGQYDQRDNRRCIPLRHYRRWLPPTLLSAVFVFSLIVV